MPSRKKTKPTAEKRRELQVAAAVAREAVLQAHVGRALELIELAGNRVSVMRMLDIYTRVNTLSRPDAEVLANRLLAVVGRGAFNGEKPVVYVEGEDEAETERGLLGVVRDRLKGRTLLDLRRWVELHTGATQVVMLGIHVQHALRFVELLSETHSIADALKVYGELVEVPKTMTDALYIYVLDRLAAEQLPTAAQVELEQDDEQVPLFPIEQRPKRAV